MRLELVPLLLVALLMISAGGADVETAELLIEGDHEITEHRGALIVGDATVTIPSDAEISGPVYVIGGELRVSGTVAGNVTQLSGSLVVEDGATIGDELQLIAGASDLSESAAIAERTDVEIAPADPDPIAAYAPLAVATLVLALVGRWLARTRPYLLDNAADAASDHPAISLTVGGLLSVTFLSVFVFMAFTLILVPVSILGLAVGALTIAYGVVVLGHLLGRRFETSRTGAATAGGVIAVAVLLELLGFVPVVGDLVAIGLLLTGLGAVVVTYFGLATFEPVTIPE